MKKNFYLYKLSFLFLLLLNCTNALAQERPLDSLSIRKDYSLADPVRYDAFFDIKTGMYYLYPKIGNTVVGAPIAMTSEEYRNYVMQNNLRAYYAEKSLLNDLGRRKDQTDAKKKGLIPAITVKNKMFENIFGSNKIELIPQGFASVDLAGLYQKIDNPLILPQNRTSFAINIQQRIQLGLTGKVGENLQLKANYDTQSGFAFENRMNMVWQAKGTWKDLQSKGLNEKGQDPEDKIIKRVEVGNISMPLSTSLIRGSQSLFGLKTEFQLGKTTGTLVFSQQQGEAKTIVAQGGGMMSSFKINAIDYEDNQHYFLGRYFLDKYDGALANYPLINSRVNITRIEVWVLDQGGSNLESQKPIVAVRDLGDQDGVNPNNANQGLYSAISGALGTNRAGISPPGLLNGNTFPGSSTPYSNDGEQYIYNGKARKLTSSEYKFNSQLGYLSLNQRLNDQQFLAVSYSYTLNGSNTVYKVGEFSEENSVLITKMIKSNVAVKTTSPMWDLMMKNIYSLNTSQIQPQNFLLNVYFKDPSSGGKVNYLPGANTTVNNNDTNLLRLFNWDRLNANNDAQQSTTGLPGDGIFDFVNGITVDAENGRLIFTKAKPFVDYLESVLTNTDKSPYLIKDLYTKFKAQLPQEQRYTIEGRYKGSQGQGISLGAINVPQGSVKVTANGTQLVEGVDYTVDYMLGTVNIINEAVKQSGQAINVQLENQLTFNTQRKSFWGINLERKFNEHFTLGATAVNYTERPLTQKVNYGQEAVSNTMAGFNMMYNNELPFLTRLTDKIPFVNTEAPSNLNFKAEGAYLIPGQSKGINNQSYIDDFEQTTSKISLKEPSLWSLASRPEKNIGDPVFPQNVSDNSLSNGNGRGLLSWYTIDPRFYGVGGSAPAGINAQVLSNHASRRVQMQELYNNRDYVAGEQTLLNTFDITYYPDLRGPYNVNPNNESASQRWAGLMRPISVTNFVTSNIDYVEFWLMDPRADGNTLGNDPKLLLQLGNVSEDVLKDGKLQYENGLPTASTPSNTSTTNWGTQPSQQPILYAFSSEGDERAQQDLGYDGLNGTQEQQKFGVDFVNPITNELDPASDNFLFYMSNQFQGDMASSLVQRYKYFRGPEGNSASNSLEVATQTPDAEDINRDYNLDQTENYNQYSIDLSPASMALGADNKIVDIKEVDVKFENGQSGKVKWYLFRIPVANYEKTTVDGSDASVLNNVRFARLLLKGFDKTSTLRFGSFDLVRSDWRKYTNKIYSTTVPNVEEGNSGAESLNSNFDVGSVNLEENALGTPPYVLPPGIDRQVLSGNSGVQRQNESSLYMKVDRLKGESRGVFKNTSLDMRRYKNLELFVHAENQTNQTTANVSALDPNAKFFIRFGSDATDNYYEYESSLTYTAKNATSPLDIWPDANSVNLEIENFVNAKLKRDELLRAGNYQISERFAYADYGDENKKIYVKGRPSIGNVTTIMLGVRNNDNSNAEGKTLVLWVNEIRLSEIENKGGYAGNASLNFNLGDFALVNASASYASIGFGAIDQKPSERSQDENSAFSINTTVNVDKFLPEKSGIKIPLNYSYTQTISDPKYNPLDNDVELTKAPNEAELKKVVRTYTQQRSIGVVNMRKERMNPDKKAKFYDIENLNVTAIYNDDFYRDIYTKRNYQQYLKGYLEYNYTFKPYVLRPFNKMISDTAKSYKYLRWAKEFNFNPVPTRLSFRTILDRNYNELEYRNVDALLSGNGGSDFDVIRNRNFFFGWQYSLGFNFTKSLKLEINSETKTLNDQIDVNSMNNRSIFSNPFRAGRPVLYNHRAQLNYRLPFEYFPYLDFINAEVSYQFQYNWNARSTAVRSFQNPETGNWENLGNISQNTNAIIGTSTIDIPKFFGKFNYFKKINDKLQKRRQEIDSLNNVYNQAFTKKNSKFKFKSYKFKNKLTPIQALAYALTSFKQINLNYNENNGIVLPGLLSAPNFFGYGQTLGGPTVGFLLGSQADIRRTVIENGWASNSTLMNDAYSELNNRTFTGDLQVMPANDLRIDFNVLQNYSRNYVQGGYNVVDLQNNYFGFRDAFGTESITYSNTAWTFNTAFRDGSALYQSIKENALAISQLYDGIVDRDGYVAGYSRSNSYVLIPAFKAAIEGKSPKKLGNPTKAGVPLPNWKIVYSGLRNLPIVNSQFSKFDILHSYVSTFTMSGIQSSIDFYNRNINDVNTVYDSNGNRYNPYTFTQVGYVEAFAPLVGFDVTMRNNMQFRFNYNRDRTYLLGLTNTTLTEEYGNEFVVGYGYILKNLKLRINYKGKPRDIKSDLNMRADLSMRDSKTTLTNILIDDSQVTGGQKIFSLKLSADYNMSQNLNLKFFYDQMMTKYKISTAFPLSTIRAGITATMTFGGSGN